MKEQFGRSNYVSSFISTFKSDLPHFNNTMKTSFNFFPETPERLDVRLVMPKFSNLKKTFKSPQNVRKCEEHMTTSEIWQMTWNTGYCRRVQIIYKNKWKPSILIYNWRRFLRKCIQNFWRTSNHFFSYRCVFWMSNSWVLLIKYFYYNSKTNPQDMQCILNQKIMNVSIRKQNTANLLFRIQGHVPFRINWSTKNKQYIIILTLMFRELHLAKLMAELNSSLVVSAGPHPRWRRRVGG